MTMPHERTRSLRWGWELLSTLRGSSTIDGALVMRAIDVASRYPSPETVATWISQNPDRLPRSSAVAIEDARHLFLDVRGCSEAGEELQRDALFALRHYPLPGAANHAAKFGVIGGLSAWLQPEDTYPA